MEEFHVKLSFSLAFIRLRSQHLKQSVDSRQAVQKLRRNMSDVKSCGALATFFK